MTSVRPALALLWPSYTLFPLAGLAALVFGVVSHDGVLATIGFGFLALNALVVANYAYFTELRIEGDELVYRTFFGTHRERVAVGSLHRIDAKRYPGAHSGVSAPHFVARGRATTVKVNTKPYRLRDFAALIATLRVANASFELDPFWSRVAAGEDVTKEVALTPRSRW
ncbi:MAG TPA: hypothetical protein VIN69_11940 [Candidatus Limnocylindria bacterium]|jgi:hypothetical protein